MNQPVSDSHHSNAVAVPSPTLLFLFSSLLWRQVVMMFWLLLLSTTETTITTGWVLQHQSPLLPYKMTTRNVPRTSHPTQPPFPRRSRTISGLVPSFVVHLAASPSSSMEDLAREWALRNRDSNQDTTGSSTTATNKTPPSPARSEDSPPPPPQQEQEQRRPLVLAGNWNQTPATLDQAIYLLKLLHANFANHYPIDDDNGQVQLVVFPPFPFLAESLHQLQGSGIHVGAQTMSTNERACTGQVSVSPWDAISSCWEPAIVAVSWEKLWRTSMPKFITVCNTIM